MQLILWGLALGGTALFALKMLMLLVGGHGFGEHEEAFADVHVGDQAGGGEAHGHTDASNLAFQFFSVQALAVLCMGTGWMGLAALWNGAAAEVAIAGGLVFGALLVLVMGKLMQKARALESSGTLDIRKAVGQRATVYLKIPRGGVGQVQVVVQERLVTLDARTAGAELPTGAKVRVDGVEDRVLLVSPE
jgi:hypothetical protein